MSKRFIGNGCLTDLIAAHENNHPAFKKGNNGKVYFDFVQWENDYPDDRGHITSLQLQQPMDDTRKKVYFGNTKLPKQKDQLSPQQTKAALQSDTTTDNLPF